MTTLPAFSDDELDKVHILLAAHVVFMMGRKLEEADWTDVYCEAKGIPHQGWSNLGIDVIYKNLGVDHKALGRPATKAITTDCGTTLMHPALTRAFRIPSLDADPNEVMRDVFRQYDELVQSRRKKVLETSEGAEPDLRIGWLLWQSSLRQFMYFEEPVRIPDPDNYYAVWVDTKPGGRLGSKNLWIYEKESKKKRYSVTTEAGGKIQPYFDVPAPDDPNLYVFTVQGEELAPDRVRVWISDTTAKALEAALGGKLDSITISKAILEADSSKLPASLEAEVDQVMALEISRDAYERLMADFPGPSDEMRFRRLVESFVTSSLGLD